MIEFLTIYVLSYIWHACGITIGYHRLLSHRSFGCAKWAEYFWVFAGFMAVEGSPIWWATMHRAHHRHVDTPLDPHSPRYGMANATYGWLGLKEYPSHIDPALQAKDLLKDPVYRFLEQGGDLQKAHALGFAINIAFRLVILYFFGWIPALASMLAGLTVLAIPLMLNVICHLPKFGYKNYEGVDDSVNVWWVGILACGEGWHNNHHAAPASARTGIRPWEFDLSWLIIKTMKALGIIGRMNVATHEQLVARFNTGKTTESIVPAGVKSASSNVKVLAQPVALRTIPLPKTVAAENNQYAGSAR